MYSALLLFPCTVFEFFMVADLGEVPFALFFLMLDDDGLLGKDIVKVLRG